jgi:hypothetical protein
VTASIDELLWVSHISPIPCTREDHTPHVRSTTCRHQTTVAARTVCAAALRAAERCCLRTHQLGRDGGRVALALALGGGVSAYMQNLTVTHAARRTCCHAGWPTPGRHWARREYSHAGQGVSTPTLGKA